MSEKILRIKVNPGAAQNKILGKFLDEKGEEYLKINVSAPAQDGKANEALIKFLSKTLKIPKSKIEIMRGETARIKLLKILA